MSKNWKGKKHFYFFLSFLIKWKRRKNCKFWFVDQIFLIFWRVDREKENKWNKILSLESMAIPFHLIPFHSPYLLSGYEQYECLTIQDMGNAIFGPFHIDHYYVWYYFEVKLFVSHCSVTLDDNSRWAIWFRSLKIKNKIKREELKTERKSFKITFQIVLSLTSCGHAVM